ncbi:hypothetical protein BDV12DRAFT_200342 [Aspergillus spectabilis]
MAQHARCCLPSFGATSNGPKRPVSIKARTNLSQNLKLLSAFENNSLGPLLKTAWGLLLYRYTGLEDVCFGYQLSSDADQLLTCHLAIDESDTIRALLKKFKGENGIENDVGKGGDFDVNHDGYSLFNTVIMVRVCGGRAGGTVLSTILPDQCRARLHVKVLQKDVRIFLEWWNTDISPTQMESITRYFEHLLEQTLFNQDITGINTARFLEHDWSRICKFNSVMLKDCGRCIHDVIHEEARLHPHREAICAWDGDFTYGELDFLASKLAYYLQTHGVCPEVRVALCFDKSKWNIVAMLGVLKAGGAFVPLDPTHPAPRLRSLVESVDARTMLCSRNRTELLSTVVEDLIPLDEQLLHEMPLPPGEIIQPEVKPTNAAYLIFTSGSTGQPKGTLLEHKAFVSAAIAYGPGMDMNPDCRMLHFAAHTFDASLFESISPLIHGGCVCVPSDGERLNDVIQAINRMRVNVVCLTPSFVRLINPSSIPGVRTIILVGEAMSKADLETWSHINLVNGYGPTESAVCAALNANIHKTSDCREIGLPTGVYFWVVDPEDHNRLVPIGSPGELLLEGPTLARCYINNQLKTDEVFIYNPTWTRDDPTRSARRKDSQIKLHGQRIELGEIENNINTLPTIKHCLVFFCKSGSAKGKIVTVISLHREPFATVTPLKPLSQSEKTQTVAKHREQLYKRLPISMIPAVWLCVESLPLLPSGKLNRKEIVSWAERQLDETRNYGSEDKETMDATHSESTVEDRLASIWSRVLDLPRRNISLEEGFLSLGGDSIAAITCMGYCKKQGMGVTVQDVMQSQSVRDLAMRVKEIDRLVVYRETTEEPFGLSPIQKLHFQIRNEGQGYFNQSIRIRLNRRISEDDLRRAIGTIIRRHSMLRARLVDSVDKKSLQQQITEEVDTSYRLRVHNIAQRLDMETAISDSQSNINALKGPVLSVDLFHQADDDCFLSMVAHHLVVDIVSWRVILEDLEDILLHTQEKNFIIPSLPFSKWCRLQDERTTTLSENPEDVPAPDLAYWGMQDQMARYGEVTCETFELSLDDSRIILAGCHGSLGTEPIDILLASLLHAFGQTFKDRPLPVIYNEGHGREPWDSTIDISRTVGWFTTLFPVTITGKVVDDPIETLVLVKDLRRRVSDNGRQQFASRTSGSAKNGAKRHPCPMEITFNYVGQHRDLQRQDGLFQLMDQMAGETGRGGGASDFGEDTPRFALFEISALAVNGKLRFIFSFSKYMQHQERVRDWVSGCGDVLKSLGSRLESLPTRPTLSDFPMLSLTYPELENIFSKTLPRVGVHSPDLIEDIYPCSLQDTYEVRRLEGKPDATRLVEAWQLVVARHAMLRTLFVENLTSRDLFSQVVLRSFNASPILLSCLEDSDVVSTFDNQSAVIYNEFQPHHRLTLCQTAKGKLFVRLELSHAAMDGASISIILRDLQLAYDGRRDYHKPLFKNYMHYLRNVPQGASIDYWRTYLADIKPCLFPTLNDGKPVLQKELKSMKLGFNLFGELQAICEDRRLTLSTAFTTAWGLTLRLFCNTNDVCFSYLTSLRDSPADDIESMVGPVINLLACRMRVSKYDLLRDILQRVQNDFMQQLPHNSLSFIDIQHELKLADTALFNTGISFQKTTKADTQSTAGISFSRICKIQDPAEYPVFVNVLVSGKEAEIELSYWTDILCDEQAENISSIYVKYLEDIARHHGEQLDRVEALSEWNKRRIRSWNKQPAEEADICVHDVIRERATSYHDAPAIIGWDGTLTYSDLEHFSSNLATYLTELGVRTGTPVPIYFEKSIWQIVAILAVFRSGGICVPRDDAQPKSQLDKWLIDNGAHIAITSPSGADLLEGEFPVVVALDELLIETSRTPSPTSAFQVQSSNDSYVIFPLDGSHDSSAIVLDQRAILARAGAFASAVKMDSETRTLQFAPYTSDIFLQEVIGTIMHGGCLCISKSSYPSELSNSINAMKANLVSLTPSIASLILPVDVPSIQVLVLFGEIPTKDVQQAWAEKAQLYCLLGTPECSSTCTQISRFDTLGALPTLRANTAYCSWLVDPLNCARLVPVGCVGELVIEGSGVSHGYLCDDDQTTRRFVRYESHLAESADRPYLLSSRSRRQLFKTGYMARYNSDGSMVYLGRKGDVEKQRSQMGALEIEKFLETLNLPGYRGIAEAIELGNEEHTENSIVVFMLPTIGQPTTVEEVTTAFVRNTSEFHQQMAKLHASLPANQLSGLYIPVRDLPLTPLGTVNRSLLKNAVRALPASSLLEYNMKKFGEFWRLELEKPSPTGQPLLQPLSTQGSPAPKLIDRGTRITWGGAMQRSNARSVLLCAWALAINSYTQRDDIITGELLVDTSPTEACPPQATIVPRRIRINKLKTITELLDQVSSSLEKAEPFARGPLSSIRNLNVDTARATNFETALSVSSADVVKQTSYLEHLETEIRVHSELSVCPLAVFCALEETGVCLAARYDDRSLYQSQVERLLALFSECLDVLRSTNSLGERVVGLAKKGNSLRVFNETVSYWKEKLADVEPCLFPRLTPRKKQEEFSTERLRLSNATKIQNACKALTITPNLFFQVVWALVLRCYTGMEEVCFGYYLPAEKGPASILPCRLSLSDAQKLRDVLQKRKEDNEQMLKHQMPLFETYRAVGSENSPIFDTVFRYGKTSAGATEFGNAILNPADFDQNPYLLVVNAGISGPSAEITFEYSSTSFSSTDIGHIFDSFEHTLNSVLTLLGPDRLIKDVEFIGPRSLQKLSAWNATLPEHPKRCAHTIIQEQVSAQPSAPAICSWDENFTYAQLDSSSTRLAYHLMDHGVGPEVFVGLCFEKSAWAVIAQVAILKAGGAFACLDPSQPESRLKGLVDDINAPIVLCSTRYLEKVSRICKAALAVSPKVLEQIPEPLAHKQLPLLKVENAAYAVFTSGTTGKPKVTVLQHAALGVASSSLADCLGINSDTRALQFSSFIFDLSVFETVIILMTGGCVCVPSEEERLNDVAGAIRRMSANFMSTTPSVTAALDPSSVPTLRTILNGGEKLTENQIARWADRRFFNAYGPSEATIIATARLKVDENGERLDDDSNCIGTAVSGRAWIVDPYNCNRLLPVGAVGELVLEGHNIARGYLNNDKKTKEVFITQPRWCRTAGLRDVFRRTERMYRTGDLVHYKSDGNMCFISRMDTQVKLNGQRIELGEIEQQCTMLSPAGTQAAVEIVTPETRTVGKVLAAFFTVDGQNGQNEKLKDGVSSGMLLPHSDYTQRVTEKLHRSLVKVLPQLMIPKLYFSVRYLPLGPTGKLDRKGLQSMVQSLSKEQLKPYMIVNADAGRAMEQASESTLRNLWGEVLEIEPNSISVEDSFFGLGGDSFSAMKLVGAARSHDISLTVAKIYEHPVLADMTKCCEDVEDIAERQTLEPFSLVPHSVPMHEILEEVADQCGITEESISDIYPCSAVQEGLLTLSIQQRGAYVAQARYQLAANVDLKKFKASWQQVVDEFDILRTRIVHTEVIGFLQVVLKRERISWTLETTFDDLSPDNLENNGGPLAKYAIVQQGPFVRYFVWIVHHALYDGWNAPQMLRRVEEIYSGSSAANLTVPYKFFIQHLTQRDMVQSDNFWKTHLDGLSCIHFPPQKNQESRSAGKKSIQRHEMDLSRASGAADITIPELIRAAWAIVLSVHTSSGDVCFGETLMGRNIDMLGITDVTGPVLTTIPMRIQVDNSMPLVQYLYDVREATTAMIPHQHSGLQRIQKLSSDAALACNFQNLLVIQSDDGRLNESIWISENEEIRSDFLTHPLAVQCKVTDSKMSIQAHHDEFALDTWQTERLIGQLSFVLEQLLNIPLGSSMTVGDLEVASPLDKQDIAGWNQRQVTSVDRCAHEIIWEQSLTQPQAPAICSRDGELTYKEMLDLASSFAAYLVSCGVGPETLVPICLDKSVWAMVTILSVLIAGGAFVPLDPSHPTSRHKDVLEEIEADIILCSPQHRSRYLGSVSSIIPISKTTLMAHNATKASQRTLGSPTPSNAAYAIFTSGSTGCPKGIIIDHRALCSSIMAFAPLVHLNNDSRVFQFASLTFDAAILEVLGTLMRGGCICVPSEDERLNDIAGAMQRMKVSWAFLTPAVACILEPSSVPSLKVLTCGGEKLSHEVVNRWEHRVKFIEGYGPTETVIFATSNSDFVNHTATCIGYGIPCTLTWIVDPDDHNRLTPLGAVGELALEGPALAREYLKNPKKTADAFVDDPVWVKSFPKSMSSPRRIYKTGDLVKYNPDGSIEYLGRKDHQVKVHGQRMELGEIEHRLLKNQSIRHGIVILPQTGPLQQKLVGVVSLRSLALDSSITSNAACELVSQKDMLNAGKHDTSAIQKSMEAQLPIYMVPQVWAVVKNIPMLVSGKRDRKGITSWLEHIEESTYDRIMQDYDNIALEAIEEEPKDNEHAALSIIRDIFAQVLNLPLHKIDPGRSFISLGGDSITGMSVVSKARKRGLNLLLKRVLQTKSVDELARCCEAEPRRQTKNEKESMGSFRLSPIQELFFRLSAAVPNNLGRFNQSITVRLTRRTQAGVVEDALRALVRKHSMLRARFSKSRDGSWQQRITDDIYSSYKFHTHSVKNSTELLNKVADTQCSLNIETGPVFAADFFEEGNQQALFLVASHLCVDVVSWRIVLQELEEFVDTGSLSAEVPLSFQSWCSAQYENSKSISRDLGIYCEVPNLNYWGMDRAPNNYGQVKMDTFSLDSQVTAVISRQCHDVLRTETIEVLLAAVIHSFGRVFTDRDVPTIYNEGHGREAWDSADPSGSVGWFTTLCPLHVRANADLLNTLKLVKDTRRRVTGTSRAFFAHNVLHSSSSGETNKFPVPLEILFNYLGQLQQLERAGSIFQHYGDVFNAEKLERAGDMGPETPRLSLFEISAMIAQIQTWISECKRVLETDMLNLKDVAPVPTLSDYPLLPTTYDGLEDLTENMLPRLGLVNWEQVEDIYPCSPVQEGILLSQVRDPHQYIFNAIFEMRYSGEEDGIDLTRLKNAWSMVVARHPTLRTVFIDSVCKGGSFDQVVLKKPGETTVEIECDDSDAYDRLDSISLQSSNKSANLDHQLVFCKTSAGRVLVKIEMNHAIIDGGSVSILLKDLALAYSSKLPTGSGPLFSDYIKYIKGESQGEALAYWKRHLSGIRPCYLPVTADTDGRRLVDRMMKYDRFTELQRFCETNSFTLANLILTTWAIVLRDFTRSDDVCFGYPSTGRDLPVSGIQDAVGIFINTLCCRVNLQNGQTLLDVCKTVQNDHITGLAHQRSSLAEIQHELGMQGKPLFNTCISIQNHSGDEVEKGGILFEYRKAYDPAEYPFTINVETARGREGILLRYWADAMSEREVAAFEHAIARVFNCFLEDPARPVADLKIRDNEGLTNTENSIDRNSLERIVDERIKVIINQMFREGKLVMPWAKGHDADLSSEISNLEKEIEESLQGIVLTREKTPSDSTQTLTDCRAPTDAEKQLWRLWSIILGLPPNPVKYRDSFFKLGGDSITAMKLVAAAREEGMMLTVADVFRTPVFENMLALVSEKKKPVVSSTVKKHKKNIEKVFGDRPMLPRSESSQEISILKPIEFDDTSLRAAISPRVGVFKGGIVDVLPVTDFQSLSIAATMFESRWMLNYFYLEGQGPLDIRRLRESFLRVVDAFDILRTVFVCFHGQFFQVVLRKIRPDIFVHETEENLDEFTKSLQQRDRDRAPGQGEQCVQFYMVRKTNSEEHRIIIRLSHAQFDGVCLSKIMTAIKMAYEGSPVSPSSFLNYMRLLPGTITPEHYQHWTTLLKGSKMTEIVQRDRQNTFQHIGGFAEQKKVIEIPSTATENVTIATVMQSAWAITLAKLCAQDDVVFGLTVNGRNAVPGVESIIGPCLNFIPIRVRFRDRWTGLDLFRFLQDQQVANMTYESLGFREIIRRCTDWPRSAFFTTTVLHQNVNYEGEMQLDKNTYKMGGVGVMDNLTDLTLFSKPVAGHPTQITVSLGYSLKGAIHPGLVSKVLDMVCDTALSLVANPNVALPSPSTLRSLPHQLVDDTPTTTSTGSLLSSLNDRSLSEILTHSDLITRIWQQVLPPRSSTGKAQTSFQLDSSFFRLGGDIINMAQVVWILEQETGLHVRLEDLLEHSTFLGQMAVLALYTSKRDTGSMSSDAAPAYAPVDTSTAAVVPGQNVIPLPPAKSEWSALDKARVLAKKITRFRGLSTRASGLARTRLFPSSLSLAYGDKPGLRLLDLLCPGLHAPQFSPFSYIASRYTHGDRHSCAKEAAQAAKGLVWPVPKTQDFDVIENSLATIACSGRGPCIYDSRDIHDYPDTSSTRPSATNLAGPPTPISVQSAQDAETTRLKLYIRQLESHLANSIPKPIAPSTSAPLPDVETTSSSLGGTFHVHYKRGGLGSPEPIVQSVSTKTRLLGQSHWAASVVNIIPNIFNAFEPSLRSETSKARIGIGKSMVAFLNDLASTGTYEETLKLDAELRAAYRALGQTLRACSKSSTCPSFFPYEVKAIDFLIDRYFLALHVSYFGPALHGTAYAFSQRAVVESSLKIWRATTAPAEDNLPRLVACSSGFYPTVTIHAALLITVELRAQLVEDDSICPAPLRPDLLSVLDEAK